MNKYSINGTDVYLLTITEISKLVGVSSRSLREWEKRGIIPPPTIKADMKSALLGKCERRLYFEFQAQLLFEFVIKAKPGKRVVIPQVLINWLKDEWELRTDKYLKEMENNNV